MSKAADLVKLSQSLAEKLETDPQAQQEIRKDPEAFLKKEGVPQSVIEASLIRGRDIDKLAAPCVDTTCWTSVCPGTCSVTVVSTWSCHCP